MCIGSDVCTHEGKNLEVRLNNFEKKIDWLVDELRVIRETLAFTAKALHSTVAPSVIITNQDNAMKPMHQTSKCNETAEQSAAIRPYPISPKNMTNGNAPLAGQYPSSKAPNCPSSKREDYQSNGSSDEKTSSPEDSENRETNSDSASKSLSDEYDSDSQIERDRRESGSDSNQGCRDWNVYNEFMTEAPQLKNLHSDSISGLDVIYLWEYGTDEMLPIRLWNESELESGGDVIKGWQQIMQVFKVDCGGSLKTFVSKYTNGDGKLMSVKEILSPATQDVVSLNGLAAPENTLSDTYSASPSSQSELSSKITPYRGTSIPRSNSTTSLQWERKREPCFILPRKINGQKVSAKDVIRIWEEGFCNIPPVKIWTPNQKLKQQSKISRWKKIVDIFKTECSSDMKLFQMRYKNDCGAMLPIAAIISKYEQSQAVVDVMGQPTMTNVNTSTMDIKVDVFKANISGGCSKPHKSHEYWRSYSRLSELAREWDFVEAQSCKEKRAFTIRQVENWQRNSMPPIDNGNTIDHLQNNSITLQKTFDEQGQNLIDRTLPHLTQPNLQAPFQRDLSKGSVVGKDSRGEANVLKGEYADKAVQNARERFVSAEPFNVIQPREGNACPAESKEQEESSVSDSLDNNSCKDVDVTGSISSESSAASKIYSPVVAKAGKDMLIKEPIKAEAQKLNEGSALQSPDCIPDSIRVQAGDAPTQTVYQSPASINVECFSALPDSDDPFEVLKLWEQGRENCPPIRFLAMKPELLLNPRLASWRKFIDVFHFHCNSDKQILVQKYSDENGRILRVSEILQHFGQRPCEPHSIANVAHPDPGPSSSYKMSTGQLDLKKVMPDSIIYTLPRKINGHKVSAKDVIHIWHHGLKNIPAVRSWLPHQKVRQQSKISRWKKIVEIFEVDCCCNVQLFEKKYSNKSGDMLPIAAIIAKYEAEKTAADGDSGSNIKIDHMT